MRWRQVKFCPSKIGVCVGGGGGAEKVLIRAEGVGKGRGA